MKQTETFHQLRIKISKQSYFSKVQCVMLILTKSFVTSFHKMWEIDLSGKVIWRSNSVPIKVDPVAWLGNVYRNLGHPIKPKTWIFKGSDINQQDSKELFVVPEFIHLSVRAFGGIYGTGKEKSVAIWANLSEEGRHLPTQCIHNASQRGGSF